MADYTPTDEQAHAIDCFMGNRGDGYLGLVAYAGAGKTSTLRLMAEATSDRGTYVAFNRSIVQEASAKFPDTVQCATAHGLAMRAVGTKYRHRLQSSRQSSAEIARTLGLGPFIISYGTERKVLQPGWLAGHCLRAVKAFCNSADREIGAEHIPFVDGLDPDAEAPGRRWGPNQQALRDHLMTYVRRAWADLSNPQGVLRFSHDAYLKVWELGGPTIDCDYLLMDEAQDLSPVMLSIARQQDHAQQVYVGDPYQQIYDWRGAVDALDNLPDGAERAYLTQSFRFGPEVARAANLLLAMLEAPKPLAGHPPLASRLEAVDRPDAVLYRTNAKAVQRLMHELAQGRRPHLVGGGGDVMAFARGALDLQHSGTTTYHELACFTSWGQVVEYVAQDPQGDELRLLVDLVEEHGADKVLHAVEAMPREADASVVISTAHKAKGREWPAVQLGGDFKQPDEGEALSDSELRLLYVACTRAQQVLDPYAHGWLTDALGLGDDGAQQVPA